MLSKRVSQRHDSKDTRYPAYRKKGHGHFRQKAHTSSMGTAACAKERLRIAENFRIHGPNKHNIAFTKGIEPAG